VTISEDNRVLTRKALLIGKQGSLFSFASLCSELGNCNFTELPLTYGSVFAQGQDPFTKFLLQKATVEMCFSFLPLNPQFYLSHFPDFIVQPKNLPVSAISS